jgi:hypothetical protein
LLINKYCDDCPYFDAETNILYADEGVATTQVECLNRDKCERIYRYLKKELEGQAEVEKLYSNAVEAMQRYSENHNDDEGEDDDTKD